MGEEIGGVPGSLVKKKTENANIREFRDARHFVIRGDESDTRSKL